jgi:signal peptidase I
MMKWLKNRRTRRQAGKLVAETRKLIRMHRDIFEARRLEELAGACDALAAAVRAGNMGEVATRREKLEIQLDKTFPPQPHAGWRENVEVLLVAAIVAMAVRSFFIQPFKIPTGSMQPTLYGIYPYRDNQRREPPIPYEGGPQSFIAKLAGTVLLGRIYESDGYRSRGDHVFVDRFTYHFRSPRRGEVVVFGTSGVPNPGGAFYIKRLVGLPGDVLRIDPPYLLANGQIVDDRPAFKRIYAMQGRYNGYQPYTLGPFGERHTGLYLGDPTATYRVPDNAYFALGDNTLHSRDSRYWGSFPRKDIVGRAIVVYWPFTARFGWID